MDSDRQVNEDEIKRPGIEMLEAWYSGDAEKMARVLHDDLAKRGAITDATTSRTVVRFALKADMVEGARRRLGVIDRSEWDISATILDVDQNIATVKVVSKYLVDICQLVKLDGEWKIVNVLWRPRGTPPWFNKATGA